MHRGLKVCAGLMIHLKANIRYRRAIPKIEKVENNKYYKTIAVKKNDSYVYGYIIVSNNESKSALEVTISGKPRKSSAPGTEYCKKHIRLKL